ncbi:MAG: amidohydrolase family protein [Bacteroidetes bacterium]|nr:amidohydrolase family protein [Bacteroidota bacterium]
MILIKNTTYIDWKTLGFTSGNVLVELGPEGNISFVNDPDTEVSDKEVTVIDGRNKFVTRSFVNAHHHAYSALATGMPSPAIKPRNFPEILKLIWWKLDKALDREMIRSCAYMTALASVRSGCTFIVDHHASPFAVGNSLETIARAFDEVGIGHLLCYEISDRDGNEIARLGLHETDHYLQSHQGLVGLHASFTLGDETLKKAAELAKAHHTGIHIHTAEDQYDQEYTLKHHQCRVVERLDKTGLLESTKTILAHCLHLDPQEKNIIKRSNAFVVQNCESNLNNRVGYFSAQDLGKNIMLGTDGMHSDMLRSAQYAYFTGLGHENITIEAACNRLRKAHHYLRNNHFTGDGENNLLVFDYNPPTPLTPSNFLGHLFYGIQSAQICHVISQGKLIMKNRMILTVDETEILKEARHQAERLWKKL